MIKSSKVGGRRRMNWSNWEGFLESYWKELVLAFAKMRIFRNPNPCDSNCYLQNVPWSNYFREIQIKTKITTSGFWLLWDACSWDLLRKGAGMWGGPGLDLWPSWNLGPAPIFQWNFPAKYVSQKGFVDFMGSLPFLPAISTPKPWNNFLVPCQATWLFPNSLLALQVILWVLLQRLWNIIFYSRFPASTPRID